MARRRMIDPNFWQSEDVSRLSIRQRLLLIGLISNADDEGKLRGKPAFIRSIIFPYEDFTVQEIADDLDAIESIGTIQQYTVNGNKYIKLVNWDKFQRVDKPQPSLIPDPPEGLVHQIEDTFSNTYSENHSENNSEIDSKNDSGMGLESVDTDSRLKEKKRKEVKVSSTTTCAHANDQTDIKPIEGMELLIDAFCKISGKQPYQVNETDAAMNILSQVPVLKAIHYMHEVYNERLEKNPNLRVNSLRYFEDAVITRWKQRQKQRSEIDKYAKPPEPDPVGPDWLEEYWKPENVVKRFEEQKKKEADKKVRAV